MFNPSAAQPVIIQRVWEFWSVESEDVKRWNWQSSFLSLVHILMISRRPSQIRIHTHDMHKDKVQVCHCQCWRDNQLRGRQKSGMHALMRTRLECMQGRVLLLDCCMCANGHIQWLIYWFKPSISVGILSSELLNKTKGCTRGSRYTRKYWWTGAPSRARRCKDGAVVPKMCWNRDQCFWQSNQKGASHGNLQATQKMNGSLQSHCLDL